jgi:hypothetical protein
VGVTGVRATRATEREGQPDTLGASEVPASFPRRTEVKTNYDTYAAQFSETMRLEDAEALSDAVMADTTLTLDERDQLMLLAFRRFHRNPGDAIKAFRSVALRPEFRDATVRNDDASASAHPAHTTHQRARTGFHHALLVS